MSIKSQWEWYVIESGYHLVGMHMNTKKYLQSLRQLLSRKRGLLRDLPGNYPDGAAYNVAFQNGGGVLYSQSQMDEFWKKWNHLVQPRNIEYHKKRVNKAAIVDVMHRSNALMENCRDTRLRRIARLSEVPPDLRLDHPTSGIYTECGETPPYVGQFGCITEPRCPADRHFEHVGKARTLKNHFVKKKRRYVPTKAGKLPSLARMMPCMALVL